MSEQSSPSGDLNEPSGPVPSLPSANSKEPKKLKLKGRWRKRFVRLVVVLALLALILRVAVYYALPKVLAKVGAAYDLDIRFERQEMTLLGGDAGLWHVTIAPKGGGEPLLKADYLRGDLSTLALLRGRLHVMRLEADGVQVSVERTADGRIPVLEKLLAGGTSAPGATGAPAPKEKEAKGDEAIAFDAPLRIDAVRLQKVRATIRDQAVSPALNATLAMDMRLSDLSSPLRPMHYEIDVWCDPGLDSMHLSGEGRAAGRDLDLTGRLAVRGLRPRPLAGYLRPLGIDPEAQSLDGDMAVTIKTQAADPPSRGIKATAVVEGLRFRADGARLCQRAAGVNRSRPGGCRVCARGIRGCRWWAVQRRPGRGRGDSRSGVQADRCSSARNAAGAGGDRDGADTGCAVSSDGRASAHPRCGDGFSRPGRAA